VFVNLKAVSLRKSVEVGTRGFKKMMSDGGMLGEEEFSVCKVRRVEFCVIVTPGFDGDASTRKRRSWLVEIPRRNSLLLLFPGHEVTSDFT
jgi:hypothetical protein